MWLVTNSDLYKEEDVVLNEDWNSKYNEELLSRYLGRKMTLLDSQRCLIVILKTKLILHI